MKYTFRKVSDGDYVDDAGKKITDVDQFFETVSENIKRVSNAKEYFHALDQISYIASCYPNEKESIDKLFDITNERKIEIF